MLDGHQLRGRGGGEVVLLLLELLVPFRFRESPVGVLRHEDRFGSPVDTYKVPIHHIVFLPGAKHVLVFFATCG